MGDRGHNRHGPKRGEGALPLSRSAGNPSNTVTGQLAYTPTRGLPTRGLDDSRTGHLADWSTRGLDNSLLDKSRTGQPADAIGDFASLVFLFGGMRDRKLSSPRLVQSAS